MGWLARLADNRLPNSIASRLRRRRMRWLADLVRVVPEPVRILDVGGTSRFWEINAPELQTRVEVTLLNLSEPEVTAPAVVRGVAGDARSLSAYDEDAFDVVFSNSVIEHVGTLDDQARMAAAVRRVGRAYFVQTPNRYFPIEPHFLVPFWQFLPRGLRVALHRRMRLGWFPPEPDRQRAEADVDEIRLLTRRELEELFPDGEILRERFAGLTKSFVVRCRANP